MVLLFLRFGGALDLQSDVHVYTTLAPGQSAVTSVGFGGLDCHAWVAWHGILAAVSLPLIAQPYEPWIQMPSSDWMIPTMQLSL